MFCTNCGAKLNEKEKFCTSCGQEVGKEIKKETSTQVPIGPICPYCHSNKVNVQIVNEVHLQKKGKGCLYWLFIGWWLEIILWIFLTLPRLIIFLFVPKAQKTVNVTKSYFVCQTCGRTWR